MGNKPKKKRASPTTRGGKSPQRIDAAQPAKPKTPWLKYGLWAVGAIGVIVLLALAFGGLAPTEEPEGIQDFSGLVREHVNEPVVYEQDPPVGGPHAQVWINCGFYNHVVPNENAVHALEHGVVWLTYDPALGEDEIDTLRDFGTQAKVLVSAYPDLGADVVASVWGRQLRIPTFDKGIIDAFVITQKDGPGTPEPGASCSGGVGQPTG